MFESESAQWKRFSVWLKKKKLLYFLSKFPDSLGNTAWKSIQKTNKDNPDLRAGQKY